MTYRMILNLEGGYVKTGRYKKILDQWCGSGAVTAGRSQIHVQWVMIDVVRSVTAHGQPGSARAKQLHVKGDTRKHQEKDWQHMKYVIIGRDDVLSSTAKVINLYALPLSTPAAISN